MLNVLIFDPERCCSSIVRCILRGRGFRTSVSHDLEEAGIKFETGLFDIVFVDASADAEACALFIESINNLAPGLPVVLLHRGGIPASLGSVQTFRQIAKPIRVGVISRAAEQAAEVIKQANTEHRRWPRKAVDLTIEVSEGAERVTCHAVNLSPGGILVESLPRNAEQDQRFHRFFTGEHTHPLTAVLTVSPDAPLRLAGTIAFTEKAQDDRVCHAGIAFVGLPKEQREKLERMLAGAA
jgi:hypothetical protein